MRYFLITDGSSTVGKNAYGGDDAAIDAVISKLISLSKTLAAREVDEQTFNSASTTQIPTTDMVAWQAAKATGAASSLSFIAKKLGLE